VPFKNREIKRIAERHNLLLIEDAAEAFGLEVGGKKAGAFGDCGVFSFCQNKVITTGDGGCVVTDSREVFEKLNRINSYGQTNGSCFYHDYVSLGLNLRMSDITAALGISQMRKLKNNIEKRREVAKRLNKGLSKIEGVILPAILSNETSICLFYSICVKASTRDSLLRYLHKNGVTAKVYHYPAHLSTFFQKRSDRREWDLPVTERVWKEILSLPLYPDMENEDVDYVLNTIHQYFSR
jgi:perosamine synthetase